MSPPPVHLRPAEAGDREMLFRWRNDPYVIAGSTTQRGVTEEEHRKWFRDGEQGDARRLFVILKGREPIGQIRFDRTGPTECVVSVYVLEPFSGQGLGTEAVRRGCSEVFGSWGMKRVVACVRNDNPAALKSFRKAGFSPDAEAKGCPGAHQALSLGG